METSIIGLLKWKNITYWLWKALKVPVVKVYILGHEALQVRSCLESVWCKKYQLVRIRLLHIDFFSSACNLPVSHLISQKWVNYLKRTGKQAFLSFHFEKSRRGCNYINNCALWSCLLPLVSTKYRLVDFYLFLDKIKWTIEPLLSNFHIAISFFI